jgi:hypothetical protein
MSIYPEQFPGDEPKWDLVHLIRNDSNLNTCFVGYKKLTPTASLGAYWGLGNSRNAAPFIYDAYFSSDTAVEVALCWDDANNPSGTMTVNQVGRTGGPASQISTCAGVANVASLTEFDGFFCPAGGRIKLIDKGFLCAGNLEWLLVQTIPAAANCYCSFYWFEMTL